MKKRENYKERREGSTRRKLRNAETLARPLKPSNLTSREWLGILLIVAAAFVLYLPAIRGGFVWDDIALTQNPAVASPRGIVDFWLHPSLNPREEHYWPVTYSSFWLEYRLWGFNAHGYHLTNVALHAANCILLFLILRSIKVPGAWIAAALFAVHPVHVESVAWIIERKDVLSAFFYFLSAFLFLQSHESPKRKWLALAILCYSAAILSKSIAVTLPAGLLVLLWWKYGNVPAKELRKIAVFFAVGIMLAGIDLAVLHAPGEYYKSGLTFVQRFGIAGRALTFYLFQLAWPAHFMAIHPQWNPNSAINFICGAAWIFVLGMLFLQRNRIGRGPFSAALLYVLLLSPVLCFVDFGWMVYSYVADRFQYLASAAILALFSAALARSIKVPAAKSTIVCLLLAFFGWRAFVLSADYGDARKLWLHNVEWNPNAWEAHHQLGILLSDEKHYPEAIDQYEQSLKLKPGYAPTLHNLGLAKMFMNDQQGAYEAYIAAIKAQPDFADAHNSLGAWLADHGRLDDAIQQFKQAAQLDPFSTDARENLQMAIDEKQHQAH